MKKNDVVRSRFGSLPLWRIDEMYGSQSEFFLATLITTYRKRKAGSEQKMLSSTPGDHAEVYMSVLRESVDWLGTQLHCAASCFARSTHEFRLTDVDPSIRSTSCSRTTRASPNSDA